MNSFEYKSENEIISASDDGTCILWDIEKSIAVSTFSHHNDMEVTSIRTHADKKHIFMSWFVTFFCLHFCLFPFCLIFVCVCICFVSVQKLQQLGTNPCIHIR